MKLWVFQSLFWILHSRVTATIHLVLIFSYKVIFTTSHDPVLKGHPLISNLKNFDKYLAFKNGSFHIISGCSPVVIKRDYCQCLTNEVQICHCKAANGTSCNSWISGESHVNCSNTESTKQPSASSGLNINSGALFVIGIGISFYVGHVWTKIKLINSLKINKKSNLVKEFSYM